MLTVIVKPVETYDEVTETFGKSMPKPVSVSLEHSLISISKWEATWKQAFLGNRPKTPAMVLDYIVCMIVTPKPIPDGLIESLQSAENQDALDAIQAYIDDEHTATHFANRQEKNGGGPQDTVTSELIYSWIVECNLDWSVERWHLGRLLTLIHVCEIQNARKERAAKENRSALRSANAARHRAHRR